METEAKRSGLTLSTAIAAMAAFATFYGILAKAQSPNNGDPVIQAARASALAFAETLPDYVVKRTTTRYQGMRGNRFTHDADVTAWQRIDSVTADVTYQRGNEVYTGIEIDGKPAKNLPQIGAWAANEFSSVLLGALAPKSNARFTNQRQEAIANQPAFRYDYAVDRSRSTWLLDADAKGTPAPVRYTTAYSGEIWIGRESGQVLRIQRLAQGVPDDFPLDAISSVTDYRYVQIGAGRFEVPTHSESYLCERDHRKCLRNDTVFGEYKKFGAEASVTFGDDAR